MQLSLARKLECASVTRGNFENSRAHAQPHTGSAQRADKQRQKHDLVMAHFSDSESETKVGAAG